MQIQGVLEARTRFTWAGRLVSQWLQFKEQSLELYRELDTMPYDTGKRFIGRLCRRAKGTARHHDSNLYDMSSPAANTAGQSAVVSAGQCLIVTGRSSAWAVLVAGAAAPAAER